MQSVFLAGNLLATAGWLLLIGACLVPQMRTMALRISGLAVPAILCVAYLGLLYVVATSQDAPIEVTSLDGVRALLGTPEGAVTGWFHYLAFDLFVGGWIARDAIARGLGAWWLPPVLLATFIAGPVGLVLYLAIRTVPGRRGAQDDRLPAGG